MPGAGSNDPFEALIDSGFGGVGLLELPTLPYDGTSVLVDAQAGEVLRRIVHEQIRKVTQAPEWLPTSAEIDMNYEAARAVGTAIMYAVYSSSDAVQLGSWLAISGEGLVRGIAEEDEDTEEETLYTLDNTTNLFGRFIGIGHETYFRVDDVYQPIDDIILRREETKGFVAVVENVRLCMNEGYGALDERVSLAAIPIAEEKLRIQQVLADISQL